jgi:hypothetical protein
VTGLHYDADGALLHQLAGTKRVWLFPPHARPWLYPISKFNLGAELSAVDVTGGSAVDVMGKGGGGGGGDTTGSPTTGGTTAFLSAVDTAKFPLFSLAASHMLTVDVPAGSVLFIPPGWWHAVQSLSASVSVALRSYTRCQRSADWLEVTLGWLHKRGLYKAGNCVCHPPY